jgi:hypothetical protein
VGILGRENVFQSLKRHIHEAGRILRASDETLLFVTAPDLSALEDVYEIVIRGELVLRLGVLREVDDVRAEIWPGIERKFFEVSPSAGCLIPGREEKNAATSTACCGVRPCAIADIGPDSRFSAL